MNNQEIKEAIEYFKADTFLDKHIKYEEHRNIATEWWQL